MLRLSPTSVEVSSATGVSTVPHVLAVVGIPAVVSFPAVADDSERFLLFRGRKCSFGTKQNSAK